MSWSQHHSTELGELVMMTVVCLSVCLSVRPSVCPVPDPKSRTEGCRKLNIVREESHDTGNPWPHLEIERSMVKVTRQINAVTENQVLNSAGSRRTLDPAPPSLDPAPKLWDLKIRQRIQVASLKIENVEFCSAISLLVITHHDSYKYAFKTLPLQHALLSFLPRDAMRNRGLCCRQVSVRPPCSCIISRWPKVSLNFLFSAR